MSVTTTAPPHASSNASDEPKSVHAVAIAFIVLGVLATTMAASLVAAITVIAGYSPRALLTDPQLEAAAAMRAPHTIQAFGNLLLFDVTCALGAALYSRRALQAPPHTRRQFAVTTAVFAGAAAILMHASVWGMPIIVPSQYTLLTPDHLSVTVFPTGMATPGSNPFQASVLSVVIHLFSPQVLAAVTVCALAIRRARQPST